MYKDNSLLLKGSDVCLNLGSFVSFHQFLTNLKRSYKKKNVLVSKIYVETEGHKTLLVFSLFFRSRFSSRARRFFFKPTLRPSLVNKKSLTPFKQFSLLGSQFYTKNVVLNTMVDFRSLKILYNQFSFFERGLFSRRFNVFLDFLKVVSLFKRGLVDVSTFTEILAEIFRYIQKGSHSRYIFFVKYLFSVLCGATSESGFGGMRLFLSGKLLGKPRSSTVKIIKGCVPLKSVGSSIAFHSLSIQTGYGTFGLKVWVNNSNSARLFL
jgi:hypothetical protein